MLDLTSVGAAINEFTAKLSAIRLKIEDTKRDIEDVQYAPACLEDVMQALGEWAESSQNKYQDYIKGVVLGLQSQPQMLSDVTGVSMHLRVGGFLPEPSMHMPITRDMQLCGLLGKSKFIELVRPQLEAMDWSNAGLPMSKRTDAVNALQDKIAKFREIEDQLIQSAARAGLNVS